MKFIKQIFLISGLLIYGYSFRGQIQVKAVVDHIKNDGVDTQGNIYLTVSGGTSPYTYKWTPGSTTAKDKTNAAMDFYTVKVKDSAPDSVNYYYNLGYKTDWYKYNGLMLRNDTLMSNGSVSYPTNGDAISKNTLPASTDGWCEFVAPAYSYPYIIGFLDSIMPSSLGAHYDIDLGFHQTSGSVIYAFYGGSFYYLGTLNEGDVVKIDRTAGDYNITVNNSILFTNTANTRKLKVKALINSQPLEYIGVSFNDTTYLERLTKLYALVDHVETDDVDSIGNIYLGIESGSSPYDFLWSPGSITTRDLLDAEKDTFTVKVKDALNDSLSATYRLGYKIHFKDLYGSSESGDTLYAHSALTPTGSASGISINELRPYQSGWVQFITPEFGTPYVLGFLDSNSVASSGDHNAMDFALHVSYGGALYAFSSGSFYYLGTAERGDILMLEKSGSTFSLSQNGTVLHTDAALNHKNYKVRAQIYQDFYLHHIGASFADSTTGNPLIALADVDHLIGDGTDSLGAIALKVYGGSTPYAYAWIKPGISTVTKKHRGDLTVGTYSLRVTDYENDTISHVYKIGIKAKWDNFNGTFLRNDSLLKDGSSMSTGDYPVSITLDSLAKDSAGWAEHVIRPYVSPYVIGFLDSVSVSNTLNINDIDFAYQIRGGDSLYAWHGGSFHYASTVTVGDVIRVGRRGTTYYIQNDSIQVYSTTLANTKAMQVKAMLVGPPSESKWSYITHAGVSNSRCFISAAISSAPEIYFSPPDAVTFSCSATGGHPPLAIAWTPNNFFNSPYTNATFTTQVNPPMSITYTATITDTYGCLIRRTIDVISTPYAPLNKIPDGGYYKLTNNKMLFKFDGQYATTGLVYKVFNKNNALETTTTISSMIVKSGDNRYALNATSLSAGYYVLEVTNEKKEKVYLKFIR
jgi:hypothetical protein